MKSPTPRVFVANTGATFTGHAVDLPKAGNHGRNMLVLIIENQANTEFGQVGVALAEAGAKLDIRRPWAGEALPALPDGFDGLVVLGGDQSAVDDALHPYLADLADLMRVFGEADRPVLGICLGSQLLARGHGGENLVGAAPEFGWQQVALTEAGKADPVFSAVSPSFPIFEWHRDTFTLPKQAMRLAGNGAAENQCFRVGRASYGMQFHFEASSSVVANWNLEFADLINSKHPDWLPNYPATAERFAARADATGLAIARAWVSLMRSG